MHYQEALKIYKKTLPPQHTKFASTYNNIGAIYDDQNKLDDALAYYTDAAKIYRNLYPSTHPNVMKIEENIKRISSQQKK
jgi:tetratricopeptide (TPR) repeat protein